MAYVPLDVRTRPLPFTSPESYRYASLLAGGAEENYEEPQTGLLVSLLRFEPSTHRTEIIIPAV
jgi:hypothetical protein